jgi:hypothetical protein
VAPRSRSDYWQPGVPGAAAHGKQTWFPEQLPRGSAPAMPRLRQLLRHRPAYVNGGIKTALHAAAAAPVKRSFGTQSEADSVHVPGTRLASSSSGIWLRGMQRPSKPASPGQQPANVKGADGG